MTRQGWILLAFVSYLLIFFPCALAFWIEYTTPAIGVGCRSLTILLYACTQFVFVLLSAWSHFKVARDDDFWRSHRWLAVLRRRWVGMSVAIGQLLPAWAVALFTVFAGTLMQITGIFQNCLCASTGYWKFGSSAKVSLASDTARDRASSRNWKVAGYIALIFLACVTYLGWWCQSYLRETFIERVKHLIPPADRQDETGGFDISGDHHIDLPKYEQEPV